MLMPATQQLCLPHRFNSLPVSLSVSVSCPYSTLNHSPPLPRSMPMAHRNPANNLLAPHNTASPHIRPRKPIGSYFQNHNVHLPIPSPAPTPSAPKHKSASHLTHPPSRPIAKNGATDPQGQSILSSDSQNTDSPSSSSLNTPDLLPPSKPPHPQKHNLPTGLEHGLRQKNGYRNTHRPSPKTPNSRKRKPAGLQSDSDDAPSGHTTRPPPVSNPTTPRHTTPKRQRTDAAAGQTLEPMDKPLRHFMLTRFATPKDTGDPNGDLSMSTEPPSDHSAHLRDPKGKARETRPASRSRRARSRSLSHFDSSSDESDPGPLARQGPSRTPKPKRNPHIYGLHDRQTDGEVSLITAETPMHQKNRRLRRGDQPDDRTLLGHNLERTTLRRSGSSSSGASNGDHRPRRGSRASSIGSGHEALPHPRIPPGMLHRHIRQDIPPSARCRTLLSWSSQKAEHACLMALHQPTVEPTRLIISELPRTLQRALDELARRQGPRPAKPVAKAVKMALRNFIRGVCESEVRVEMGAGERLGLEDESVSLAGEQSVVDLESLPRHPQDLKNELKIKELNHWRTRISYEDHGRQFQLSRYNPLIENLTRAPSGPSRVGPADETRLDTARLGTKAAVLEFGRLLRAQASEPDRRVDVVEEHGGAWREVPVTMGVLAEEVGQLAAKVRTMEAKVGRLQAGSTQKLKGLESHGAVSSIEAKMMAASLDGVGACLEALDIGGEAQVAAAADRPRRLEQRGKRDFLRSLSRCVDDES